jgi:pimeloyl-ACP methyl ester carboxylesterase
MLYHANRICLTLRTLVMRDLLSAITILICLSVTAHGVGTAEVVIEEFMVEAADPGIQLYVRNKHPANMEQVPDGRVLLYVHGATQPSEATFDLPLEGASWMDTIAAAGWDVYLMDARGYGGSTRSSDLAKAGAEQAPFVRTDAKVQDLSSVVDFILKRRRVDKINLLGWSWGTIVTAAYTAAHGDRVSSLVLHAPVWCEGRCAFDANRAASLAAAHANSGEMAAVVESLPTAARKRFQSGAPQERIDELMPSAWFEAWSTAVLATDPIGANQKPPVTRIPPGVSQDFQDYWSAGNSYYDPKAITAPTLVIVAEWDAVTPPAPARSLFDALSSSTRRFIEIKEGTHIVMLEKSRKQLFRAVQQFLDETNPK